MNKLLPIFVLFFCVYSVNAQVSVQETTVTIPSYVAGEPGDAPLFYTPEVYQGAQLRIYPYPYIGKLSSKKVDKIYKAVILENEYIKICVLPELGGRLYYAQDKTNGYDFVYRNNVIKPALIGMTGAWISGGAEWNVPHHHRASSFMPVDYKVEENTDGSKTIWVGEYEKRSQTRWVVGLTLYPGKSYVEASLRYYNVTPVTNSFLFWANTAVHANENYQVIFPPDVEKAVFHSKTQFTDFPVSHQKYQGIDFTKGVDVSWWKNTSSPTSYFAWDSKKDFIAGIDHGKQAGTAIIGNHYTFPGKKFWNWGNNDVQKLWDQMLTDGDGPYLELMMGMYSDNQPDYSWNSPYGVKSGTMYYYPVKKLTSIKEANKDVAVNLEIRQGKVLVQVNTTSRFPNSRVALFYKGKELLTKETNIDPVLPYTVEVKAPSDAVMQDFTLLVLSAGNEELVRYIPPAAKNSPEPPVYKTPGNPSGINSADELYLTGLRIEQFASATLDPVKYYLEALKRDSNHVNTNTQLGIHYLKPGLCETSQKYLEKAAGLVTQNYTSPKNGEPLYYLGLNLFYQERFEEAYSVLYKASWSHEWASPAFYLLALIDCANGEYNAAIDKLSESLTYNAENVEAINLMAIILRRNGEVELARQTLTEAKRIDPLNLTAAFEQFQLNKSSEGTRAVNLLHQTFRDEADNYLETASRYFMAGFYSDAAELLRLATVTELPVTSKNPLIYYYWGYCYTKSNEIASAKELFLRASAMKTGYCFPYGHASYTVLNTASKYNAGDATALQLLGNLLCDISPEAAYNAWNKSLQISPDALVKRNMAFIEANILDKPQQAVAKLDEVIGEGAANPLFLLERDVYAAYLKESPADRLAFLEKYAPVTSSWDKTELRRAELLNLKGDYNKAIEILKTQHFYIAEITSLNPHMVWSNAYLAQGINYLKNNETDKAIASFNEVLVFPRNLEIARDSRAELANYWLGKAYQKKGDTKKARDYFSLFTAKLGEFSAQGGHGMAVIHFYQALALQQLGNTAKATEVFQKMIEQGNSAINHKYHEASLDQSVNIRFSRVQQKAEGYFYLALGNKGLSNDKEADVNLKKVIALDPSFFDINLVD